MISSPWKKDLNLLTPKQLAKYNDSLEVLQLVRSGLSFNKATNLVGIHPTTAKKFLGTVIKKSKRRLVAKKTDHLLRELRIYENGKETFIQVKGNKKAKRIAQYHSAVGNSIDNNKPLSLPFQGTKIRDSKNKSHTLETRLDKIQQIVVQREEPEFFTIYRRR